jgi:hypothetical protein
MRTTGVKAYQNEEAFLIVVSSLFENSGFAKIS